MGILGCEVYQHLDVKRPVALLFVDHAIDGRLFLEGLPVGGGNRIGGDHQRQLLLFPRQRRIGIPIR